MVDKKQHTIVINGVAGTTLGCDPENPQSRDPIRDPKSGSGHWDVRYY
jgi:hypothetical protein